MPLTSKCLRFGLMVRLLRWGPFRARNFRQLPGNVWVMVSLWRQSWPWSSWWKRLQTWKKIVQLTTWNYTISTVWPTWTRARPGPKSKVWFLRFLSQIDNFPKLVKQCLCSPVGRGPRVPGSVHGLGDFFTLIPNKEEIRRMKRTTTTRVIPWSLAAAINKNYI